MTRDQFVARYPEFENPDGEDLVLSCLAEAAAEIDAIVFGTRYDEAQGALAAHKLWTSDFGVSLRQEGSGDEGSSKYLEAFRHVQKAVTVPLSMMVI